ncbi:GIY-YIG nuclease family protein [Candidatus Gottesmanbacteria bacterium]|nr:GIY-YIG nuclease family protein [Candidatus Gottesmanbacteria bacterium]
MFLYILKNKDTNVYYIGITNNIKRRLEEHNGKHNHYTGKIPGIWKLIFSKEYNNSHDARKEETRLKKAKNKRYLEWYIDNNKGL